MRTRYRPDFKICHSLINAAPWVDLVLILMIFFILDSRVIMHPGVILELPISETPTGTQRGLTAVVLSHESSEKGVREEMVFFDDEPFAVKDDSQMVKLEKRFSEASNEHPDTPLIIEADASVRHGTIVTLCNMARKAGLQTANLAMRLQDNNSDE